MGEVIDFPLREDAQKDLLTIPENDPYYQFIHNVLTAADSCGFELPFTVDSAAKLVYRRTRKTSQLAKMMDKG